MSQNNTKPKGKFYYWEGGVSIFTSKMYTSDFECFQVWPHVNKMCKIQSK